MADALSVGDVVEVTLGVVQVGAVPTNNNKATPGSTAPPRRLLGVVRALSEDGAAAEVTIGDGLDAEAAANTSLAIAAPVAGDAGGVTVRWVPRALLSRVCPSPSAILGATAFANGKKPASSALRSTVASTSDATGSAAAAAAAGPPNPRAPGSGNGVIDDALWHGLCEGIAAFVGSRLWPCVALVAATVLLLAAPTVDFLPAWFKDGGATASILRLAITALFLCVPVAPIAGGEGAAAQQQRRRRWVNTVALAIVLGAAVATTIRTFAEQHAPPAVRVRKAPGARGAASMSPLWAIARELVIVDVALFSAAFAAVVVPWLI